jgi:hypothetical protein
MWGDDAVGHQQDQPVFIQMERTRGLATVALKDLASNPFRGYYPQR